MRDRLRNLRYRLGRLRALGIAPAHAICAEIGVWKGDFSRRILEMRRPRELHLVDPWLFEPKFPGRLYGGAAAQGQSEMDAIAAAVAGRFADSSAVTIHRGHSTDIVQRFPDRYFDWIYVDGDHSYQAVLNDLDAWHPKVKSNGIIALDDFEWRDENNRLSVKAAVQTFQARTKVASAQALWGQFLIRTL